MALVQPMYAGRNLSHQAMTPPEVLTLFMCCAGIDYTHPDLKDQIDFSQSASCVGGKLNTTREAYHDTFGHGTCVGSPMIDPLQTTGPLRLAPIPCYSVRPPV